MITSTAARLDEAAVVRGVPALLPGADAHVHRLVEAPVTLEVLLDQRVLQPVEPARVVQLARHPDRVAAVPAGEGDDIDDHLDVRADRVADRPRHGEVARLVECRRRSTGRGPSRP